MQPTVKELQKREIDILMEFQRICNLYNLRYFAIGGTCIGAVRHHGFIPWDDDIDVAMPYEDYQEFRDAASRDLKEPFELFDIDEHRHSDFNFLKLHDSSTTFVEKDCIKYKDRYTGVFIDIMPIYGIGGGGAKKAFKTLNKLLRKNHYLRFSDDKAADIKSRIYYTFNRWSWKNKKYNYYSRCIEKIFSKNSFHSSNAVLFGWRLTPINRKDFHYKTVFPYADFSEYREVPFENVIIRIPVGYDDYLTRDFGDYMTLPPVEKRVSVHPAAVIDLNKSYKEYIKENF